MSQLLNVCPNCQGTLFSYSNGIVRNDSPIPAQEYPFLKCLACNYTFFALPPDHNWKRCYVSSLIKFTDDIQNIDVKNKFRYYTQDGTTYNIVPV